MRIRFHKILAEGRSVRYDKDEDDDVLNLNVIVLKETNRNSRTRES